MTRMPIACQPPPQVVLTLTNPPQRDSGIILTFTRKPHDLSSSIRVVRWA